MKSKINLYMQGGKKGNFTSKDVGFVQILIDNAPPFGVKNSGKQYISINTFDGDKKRDESIILVRNGDQVWSGSYATLVNVLFNINKPIKQ